jgi:sigma-B regulation protein RsbU (phosphoserine phosphatase)
MMKSFSRFSLPLKTVLVVPFVLQVAAVAGLVGWLSFRTGRMAVNDLAQQLMEEVGDRILERIDLYVEESKRINQLNADLIQNDQLDLENLEALHQHFWRQIRHFPDMTYIYWADESGRFAGGLRAPDGALSIAVAENDYYERYAVDEQGQPQTLLYDIEAYDPRTRPWYQSAAAGQEANWSPIFVWSGELTLSVDPVLPVYGAEDGQLQGVVGVSLGLLQVGQFLQGLAIGQTGEAFIMERSGEIVATSTASLPFVLDSESQTATRLPATEMTDAPKIQAAAAHLAQVFEGLEQIDAPQQLRLDSGDSDLFLRVEPFLDEAGLDWLVVVVVPQSDFMAEINRSRRNAILVALFFVGGAIALGFVTARWIAAPVGRMTRAAQTLSEGQLSQAIPSTQIIELNSMGRAFNQMAAQLKASIENLEDNVATRTLELAQANDQISNLNQQLKTENRRMEAELNVVRQLQQMILPKEKELAKIQDLDIAGFMEATDEVGGDYYDIIRDQGRVVLGIGDVTGHGLASGVVMIMAQTAVRTLLALGQYDPVKVFSAINQVVYDNGQRMGSDRNLTLALMSYDHGALTIAGQHEEVLVVRAGGTVERVDTLDLGFPVGMVEDISEFVAQHQIHLDLNDGIVLYTDGIPEAENAQRKFYGLDRLIQVVEANWSDSPQAIRTAIIADLRSHIDGHIIYDDITLVVAKRRV